MDRNHTSITIDYISGECIPIAHLATAHYGSFVLDFISTIDGTLIDIQGDKGYITLKISRGALLGELRLGEDVRQLDAEDALGLDDGKLHTIGFTADETGTHLFVDGYEQFSSTLSVWFKEIEAKTLSVDPESLMQPKWLAFYDAPLPITGMVALARPAKPFLEFATAELSPRDAKRCSDLEIGSLRARFRARGLGQGGTIIAAKGSQGELALTLEAGNLYYRVYQQSTLIAEVSAQGHWDDGHWHDMVLSSGRGALILYVDGYQVALAAGAAFFTELGQIERVTVGMSLEKIRLFGEAQSAAIFDAILSDHQVKRLAGVMPLPTRALFDTGYQGSRSYRIPSLLTLQSGVILAGADQRVSIANDSPNDINFVMRRSLDGGQTWEDAQTLIQYPGSGALGASVIDSVLVQDKNSGRVLVIIDHFPGGVGQPNCCAGTGFDEQGRPILIDREGQSYIWCKNGEVLTADGEKTPYQVDGLGNVSANGDARGNVYLAFGVDAQESLFTVRTSYLQMIYSDDDGATWSAPIDITSQVKQPWMRFLGTSPGNGIQLSSGRILVPIYYNHEEGITFSCAVMFSDDGGQTWQLGQSPNDDRELFGVRIHSRHLKDDRGSLHESVLVEGHDGAVHVYMRNQHPSGRVAHAVSYDGGETWGEVDYVAQLTEIFSQPNAINVTFSDGKQATVFANASQMLPFRGCGVLRMSFDDGKTWPHNRVFNPRHYVYQCMTQLPNGNLALLWERETQGLYLTIIPLEWLTASCQSLH